MGASDFEEAEDSVGVLVVGVAAAAVEEEAAAAEALPLLVSLEA